MATQAQLEANRANAQKSTGPSTGPGSARSSQNACKHNLTGGPALAPGEDLELYQRHLEQIREDYGPGGSAGNFVVNKIADLMWRMQRLDRMEAELLERSDNPFADEDETVLNKLERLQRYRQMLERSYHRFRKDWLLIVQENADRSQRIEEEKFEQRKADFDRRFLQHQMRAIDDYIKPPVLEQNEPNFARRT